MLTTEAAVPPRDDMQDLAARIRAYLDMGDQRAVRMPLGGGLFDVVISGSGTHSAAMVAAMDEVQLGACGPVIADPDRGWLYWLVPPGTTARWEPHTYGVCVGAPHILTLPPLARDVPPGPYWLRPCVSDRLVPPNPLRDLLERFRPMPTPHESIAAALGFPAL
ncbi:hypothetical protein ABZZ36_35045 [Actinacidiphila glaucinigra]|uniref:hypothetical protein n=1 Tax=Actinacidiphila glaucinigra TaxID=235986 RepID=UPI0033A16E0B